MRTAMSALLIAVFALGLVACSESNEEAQPTETPSNEQHPHGEDKHSHDDGAAHSHDAPETEAYYGDEADSETDVAAHENEHEHDHEHDQETHDADHMNSEHEDHHSHGHEEGDHQH